MDLEVVGIVASPRKGMNTDTLVERVLEGSRSIGATTVKLYLNDLEIRACQACADSPAPGYCFFRDGMDTVYRALETADVLVIGTPAYYETVSAQLKLLIDRCNCLTEMVRLPGGQVRFRSRLGKRKWGIFIWVADFSHSPEHALATVRLWCRDANIELGETLIVTESEQGKSIREREELLRRAYQLGADLRHL